MFIWKVTINTVYVFAVRDTKPVAS